MLKEAIDQSQSLHMHFPYRKHAMHLRSIRNMRLVITREVDKHFEMDTCGAMHGKTERVLQ
jgi:hypothetical protein